MNLIILILILTPTYLIFLKGLNKWNEIRIRLNSEYQKLSYISDQQNTITKAKVLEIVNQPIYDFDKNIEGYDMFYFNPKMSKRFKELESYQKLINSYRKFFISQLLLIIGVFFLMWITFKILIFSFGSNFQLF